MSATLDGESLDTSSNDRGAGKLDRQFFNVHWFALEHISTCDRSPSAWQSVGKYLQRIFLRFETTRRTAEA